MYLKRYIHDGGQFKCVIADTTAIGRKAFQERQLSPIDLQMLTQAMTGATLLTASLKDEGSLQLTWRGDGPMGRISVDANTAGDVRGMVGHSILQRDPQRGLLAQTVGDGILSVRRRGPGQPMFESIVALDEGEIS